MAADITLASCKLKKEERRFLRKVEEQAAKSSNTKILQGPLVQLTSIIMDQVRRFMKFAIVEVVNYAAAM